MLGLLRGSTFGESLGDLRSEWVYVRGRGVRFAGLFLQLRLVEKKFAYGCLIRRGFVWKIFRMYGVLYRSVF